MGPAKGMLPGEEADTTQGTLQEALWEDSAWGRLVQMPSQCSRARVLAGCGQTLPLGPWVVGWPSSGRNKRG